VSPPRAGSAPKDAVEIQVHDGWITLDGEVHWRFQKDAARQDVRRLWGVVGVSDHITIKPAVDTSKLSDDIMHALHRSWFFDSAIFRFGGSWRRPPVGIGQVVGRQAYGRRDGLVGAGRDLRSERPAGDLIRSAVAV
jgi:hypothetical protein